MKNLNDSLPELMRRATENLEPESTDLVERGMQRGLKLRRRRTTLLSFTGATAVVATAGIIVGGTQLFGSSAQEPSEAPVASTSASAKPPVNRPAARTVTPDQTLATLGKLATGNLKVSQPKSWGDRWGTGASIVVDDGRGASLLTMSIHSSGSAPACTEPPSVASCKIRPDGTVVYSTVNEPTFRRGSNPGGVLANRLEIFRPGGRTISFFSYNGPEEKGAPKTRPTPVFSVAELTRIAESGDWQYPAKPPAPTSNPKSEPTAPGAGKPTVPLAQTQATLRKVLPSTLQFSRPQTWGGDPGGFNAASYVVNDGKGAFRVEVHLSMGTPPSKCASERAEQQCKVLPNGSVLGWTKEAPSYADERNSVNGVFSNLVTLIHKDGRTISMTSYNATSEKDSRRTRTKPGLTVAELTTIAADSRWKFPGTGTK